MRKEIFMKNKNNLLKTNTLKELKLYKDLPETLEDCTYESTIVNTINNEEYKIVGITINNALIIEGEKIKILSPKLFKFFKEKKIA